jgi:hypothetical protein
MEQGRTERNRIRLISSERTVHELFLIVYLFLFLTSDAIIGSHYLWLLLSVGLGVVAYLLFDRIEYSLGIGILLAALTVAPLYFNGIPLVIVFMLFVYSFWRLQVNFGETKAYGWPYLVLNTIFFTFIYFVIKLFFVYANADELMKLQVVLYLMTTVIYFIIRFTVIGLIGAHLRNFNLGDAGKMFTAILGLGCIIFLVVYFLLPPIRLAIIAIAGFLFGSLFMLILKGFTPLLDWFIARFDAAREKLIEETEKPEFTVIDFEMIDDTKTFGGVFLHTGLLMSLGIFLIALIAFTFIVRRKKAQFQDKTPGFTFGSGGRKKNKKEKRLVYDYSVAVDAVRTAYKEFEKEAQSSKAPRLKGETVKEWFSRMGWGQNEKLFNTYDKVRYGSYTVSSEEGSHFIEELDKIKNKYLENNV